MPNGMSCSQTLRLMEPYFFPMDPSSHCWSPGSMPDQLMWDLKWTKWQLDRFSCKYFGFPHQYYSTNARYSFTSMLSNISNWLHH